MPREITKTIYTFKELLDLYKQGKITERAVEKARRWLIKGATAFDWWEFEYETWGRALAQIGFDDADISFSGFWSQGDGASFTCKLVDFGKLVDFLSTRVEPKDRITSSTRTGEEEDFWPWLAHKAGGVHFNPKYRRLMKLYENGHIDEVEVRRTSHHYSHWNTCRFNADLRDRGEYKRPGLTLGGKFVESPVKEPVWHSRTPRLRRLFESFEETAEELRKDLSRAIYKDLEEEYEYRTKDESLIEDADANEWTFDENGRREG